MPNRSNSIRVVQLGFILFAGWLALSFLPFYADAQIYKWTDQNGKTHYTDSPAKIPRKYRAKDKGTETIKAGPADPTNPVRINLPEIKRRVIKVPPRDKKPNVNVSETYKYYDIQGLTEKVLARQMRLLGPVCGEGERHRACTRKKIVWDRTCREQSDGSLKLYLEMRYIITYTMPKWINKKSAHLALRRKWEYFYKKMDRHERAHGKIAIDSMQEYERALPKPSIGKTCSQLREMHSAELKRVKEKIRKSQKKLDKNTVARRPPWLNMFY